MDAAKLRSVSDGLTAPRELQIVGSMKRAIVLCLVMLGCAPQIDAGAKVPAFTLEDVNPNSATHGQQVGPATFEGKVSGWYFGHSS